MADFDGLLDEARKVTGKKPDITPEVSQRSSRTKICILYECFAHFLRRPVDNSICGAIYVPNMAATYAAIRAISKDIALNLSQRIARRGVCRKPSGWKKHWLSRSSASC